MSNIINKMGLYDLFARGVTGTVVLCAAHVFGIANLLNNNIPVWALLLGGYFCGLALEAVSLIQEKGFYRINKKGKCGIRKKIEDTIALEDEYLKYDFKRCKEALSANNQEIIKEEPLAHIVMSASFKISFFILAVVKGCQTACTVLPGINLFMLKSEENMAVSIGSMIILLLISFIFAQRERHYCDLRTRQIFDFCIAKGYKNIEK